jgi:hypothetical protein
VIPAPFRRVADGGGAHRQRTARASARAVSLAGGIAAPIALWMLAGCTRTGDRTEPLPRLPWRSAQLPGAVDVQWQREGAGWVGRVAGDTAPRWVLRPRTDDVATRRLCGFLATGSTIPVALPETWPVDTALPRLLLRALRGDGLNGVRYLTPGADARYWFEGLTRDGAWRVSLRWPVRSDPSRPIPAGAPDSVMAAAIAPAPAALDTLATSVVLPTASRPWRPVALATPAQAEEGAVILVRDYPDQPLALSGACPQATVVLPVLARVDKRLRIPVRRGDRVVARGSVPEGAVRLSFDEQPAAADAVARERELLRTPVPEAVITAPADGRVTLRVRVLVVPRMQRGAQPVQVTVAVNPPS